ncbi:uncharacterized protein LOC135487274 [Lineus longissimus]|uniref:uncharacterized protein LOC135487274 n=1 Tax=Lineus longissimus TaxID=88925 RepID=UPI00315C567B
MLHCFCFLDSSNDNAASISPVPLTQVALHSPRTPAMQEKQGDEIEAQVISSAEDDSTLIPPLVGGPLEHVPDEGSKRFEDIAEESDGQSLMSDRNHTSHEPRLKPESARLERPSRQASARPRSIRERGSVEVPKETYELMSEIEDVSATEADDESSHHDENEVEGGHLEFHFTTGDQSEPVESSFLTQDQGDSERLLNEPEQDKHLDVADAPTEPIITPEPVVGECQYDTLEMIYQAQSLDLYKNGPGTCNYEDEAAYSDDFDDEASQKAATSPINRCLTYTPDSAGKSSPLLTQVPTRHNSADSRRSAAGTPGEEQGVDDREWSRESVRATSTQHPSSHSRRYSASDLLESATSGGSRRGKLVRQHSFDEERALSRPTTGVRTRLTSYKALPPIGSSLDQEDKVDPDDLDDDKAESVFEDVPVKEEATERAFSGRSRTVSRSGTPVAVDDSEETERAFSSRSHPASHSGTPVAVDDSEETERAFSSKSHPASHSGTPVAVDDSEEAERAFSSRSGPASHSGTPVAVDDSGETERAFSSKSGPASHSGTPVAVDDSGETERAFSSKSGPASHSGTPVAVDDSEETERAFSSRSGPASHSGTPVVVDDSEETERAFSSRSHPASHSGTPVAVDDSEEAERAFSSKSHPASHSGTPVAVDDSEETERAFSSRSHPASHSGTPVAVDDETHVSPDPQLATSSVVERNEDEGGSVNHVDGEESGEKEDEEKPQENEAEVARAENEDEEVNEAEVSEFPAVDEHVEAGEDDLDGESHDDVREQEEKADIGQNNNEVAKESDDETTADKGGVDKAESVTEEGKRELDDVHTEEAPADQDAEDPALSGNLANDDDGEVNKNKTAEQEENPSEVDAKEVDTAVVAVPVETAETASDVGGGHEVQPEEVPEAPVEADTKQEDIELSPEEDEATSEDKPAEDEATSEDKPGEDEPTKDKATEDKPAEDEATSEDKPAEDEATSEDKPAEDEATSEDKPGEDEPTKDKATEDKPAEDEATSEDKPAEDEATSEDKPAEDEATSEDKPGEDEPTKDKATEDKPAEDEATSEDKPAEDEARAEDKPAEDEARAEDKPAEDEARAEDKPAEDEDSKDQVTEDKPANDETSQDKPAEDEATTEDSLNKPSEEHAPTVDPEETMTEREAKAEDSRDGPADDKAGVNSRWEVLHPGGSPWPVTTSPSLGYSYSRNRADFIQSLVEYSDTDSCTTPPSTDTIRTNTARHPSICHDTEHGPPETTWTAPLPCPSMYDYFKVGPALESRTRNLPPISYNGNSKCDSLRATDHNGFPSNSNWPPQNISPGQEPWSKETTGSDLDWSRNQDQNGQGVTSDSQSLSGQTRAGRDRCGDVDKVEPLEVNSHPKTACQLKGSSAKQKVQNPRPTRESQRQAYSAKLKPQNPLSKRNWTKKGCSAKPISQNPRTKRDNEIKHYSVGPKLQDPPAEKAQKTGSYAVPESRNRRPWRVCQIGVYNATSQQREEGQVNTQITNKISQEKQSPTSEKSSTSEKSPQIVSQQERKSFPGQHLKPQPNNSIGWPRKSVQGRTMSHPFLPTHELRQMSAFPERATPLSTTPESQRALSYTRSSHYLGSNEASQSFSESNQEFKNACWNSSHRNIGTLTSPLPPIMASYNYTHKSQQVLDVCNCKMSSSNANPPTRITIDKSASPTPMLSCESGNKVSAGTSPWNSITPDERLTGAGCASTCTIRGPIPPNKPDYWSPLTGGSPVTPKALEHQNIGSGLSPSPPQTPKYQTTGTGASPFPPRTPAYRTTGTGASPFPPRTPAYRTTGTGASPLPSLAPEYRTTGTGASPFPPRTPAYRTTGTGASPVPSLAPEYRTTGTGASPVPSLAPEYRTTGTGASPVPSLAPEYRTTGTGASPVPPRTPAYRTTGTGASPMPSPAPEYRTTGTGASPVPPRTPENQTTGTELGSMPAVTAEYRSTGVGASPVPPGTPEYQTSVTGASLVSPITPEYQNTPEYLSTESAILPHIGGYHTTTHEMNRDLAMQSLPRKMRSASLPAIGTETLRDVKRKTRSRPAGETQDDDLVLKQFAIETWKEDDIALNDAECEDLLTKFGTPDSTAEFDTISKATECVAKTEYRDEDASTTPVMPMVETETAVSPGLLSEVDHPGMMLGVICTPPERTLLDRPNTQSITCYDVGTMINPNELPLFKDASTSVTPSRLLNRENTATSDDFERTSPQEKEYPSDLEALSTNRDTWTSVTPERLPEYSDAETSISPGMLHDSSDAATAVTPSLLSQTVDEGTSMSPLPQPLSREVETAGSLDGLSTFPIVGTIQTPDDLSGSKDSGTYDSMSPDNSQPSRSQCVGSSPESLVESMTNSEKRYERNDCVLLSPNVKETGDGPKQSKNQPNMFESNEWDANFCTRSGVMALYKDAMTFITPECLPPHKDTETTTTCVKLPMYKDVGTNVSPSLHKNLSLEDLLGVSMGYHVQGRQINIIQTYVSRIGETNTTHGYRWRTLATLGASSRTGNHPTRVAVDASTSPSKVSSGEKPEKVSTGTSPLIAITPDKKRTGTDKNATDGTDSTAGPSTDLAASQDVGTIMEAGDLPAYKETSTSVTPRRLLEIAATGTSDDSENSPRQEEGCNVSLDALSASRHTGTSISPERLPEFTDAETSTWPPPNEPKYWSVAIGTSPLQSGASPENDDPYLVLELESKYRSIGAGGTPVPRIIIPTRSSSRGPGEIDQDLESTYRSIGVGVDSDCTSEHSEDMFRSRTVTRGVGTSPPPTASSISGIEHIFQWRYRSMGIPPVSSTNTPASRNRDNPFTRGFNFKSVGTGADSESTASSPTSHSSEGEEDGINLGPNYRNVGSGLSPPLSSPAIPASHRDSLGFTFKQRLRSVGTNPQSASESEDNDSSKGPKYWTVGVATSPLSTSSSDAVTEDTPRISRWQNVGNRASRKPTANELFKETTGKIPGVTLVCRPRRESKCVGTERRNSKEVGAKALPQESSAFFKSVNKFSSFRKQQRISVDEGTSPDKQNQERIYDAEHTSPEATDPKDSGYFTRGNGDESVVSSQEKRQQLPSVTRKSSVMSQTSQGCSTDSSPSYQKEMSNIPVPFYLGLGQDSSESTSRHVGSKLKNEADLPTLPKKMKSKGRKSWPSLKSLSELCKKQTLQKQNEVVTREPAVSLPKISEGQGQGKARDQSYKKNTSPYLEPPVFMRQRSNSQQKTGQVCPHSHSRSKSDFPRGTKTKHKKHQKVRKASEPIVYPRFYPYTGSFLVIGEESGRLATLGSSSKSALSVDSHVSSQFKSVHGRVPTPFSFNHEEEEEREEENKSRPNAPIRPACVVHRTVATSPSIPSTSVSVEGRPVSCSEDTAQSNTCEEAVITPCPELFLDQKQKTGVSLKQWNTLFNGNRAVDTPSIGCSSASSKTVSSRLDGDGSGPISENKPGKEDCHTQNEKPVKDDKMVGTEPEGLSLQAVSISHSLNEVAGLQITPRANPAPQQSFDLALHSESTGDSQHSRRALIVMYDQYPDDTRLESETHPLAGGTSGGLHGRNDRKVSSPIEYAVISVPNSQDLESIASVLAAREPELEVQTTQYSLPNLGGENGHPDWRKVLSLLVRLIGSDGVNESANGNVRAASQANVTTHSSLQESVLHCDVETMTSPSLMKNSQRVVTTFTRSTCVTRVETSSELGHESFDVQTMTSPSLYSFSTVTQSQTVTRAKSTFLGANGLKPGQVFHGKRKTQSKSVLSPLLEPHFEPSYNQSAGKDTNTSERCQIDDDSNVNAKAVGRDKPLRKSAPIVSCPVFEQDSGPVVNRVPVESTQNDITHQVPESAEYRTDRVSSAGPQPSHENINEMPSLLPARDGTNHRTGNADEKNCKSLPATLALKSVGKWKSVGKHRDENEQEKRAKGQNETKQSAEMAMFASPEVDIGTLVSPPAHLERRRGRHVHFSPERNPAGVHHMHSSIEGPNEGMMSEAEGRKNNGNVPEETEPTPDQTNLTEDYKMMLGQEADKMLTFGFGAVGMSVSDQKGVAKTHQSTSPVCFPDVGGERAHSSDSTCRTVAVGPTPPISAATMTDVGTSVSEPVEHVAVPVTPRISETRGLRSWTDADDGLNNPSDSEDSSLDEFCDCDEDELSHVDYGETHPNHKSTATNTSRPCFESEDEIEEAVGWTDNENTMVERLLPQVSIQEPTFATEETATSPINQSLLEFEELERKIAQETQSAECDGRTSINKGAAQMRVNRTDTGTGASPPNEAFNKSPLPQLLKTMWGTVNQALAVNSPVEYPVPDVNYQTFFVTELDPRYYDEPVRTTSTLQQDATKSTDIHGNHWPRFALKATAVKAGSPNQAMSSFDMSTSPSPPSPITALESSDVKTSPRIPPSPVVESNDVGTSPGIPPSPRPVVESNDVGTSPGIPPSPRPVVESNDVGTSPGMPPSPRTVVESCDVGTSPGMPPSPRPVVESCDVGTSPGIPPSQRPVVESCDVGTSPGIPPSQRPVVESCDVGTSPGIPPSPSPVVESQDVGTSPGIPPSPRPEVEPNDVGTSPGIPPSPSPVVESQDVGTSPGMPASPSPVVESNDVGTSPGIPASPRPVVESNDVGTSPGIPPSPSPVVESQDVGTSPGMPASPSPVVELNDVGTSPGIPPSPSPVVESQDVGTSPGIPASLRPVVESNDVGTSPGIPLSSKPLSVGRGQVVECVDVGTSPVICLSPRPASSGSLLLSCDAGTSPLKSLDMATSPTPPNATKVNSQTHQTTMSLGKNSLDLATSPTPLGSPILKNSMDMATSPTPPNTPVVKISLDMATSPTPPNSPMVKKSMDMATSPTPPNSPMVKNMDMATSPVMKNSVDMATSPTPLSTSKPASPRYRSHSGRSDHDQVLPMEDKDVTRISPVLDAPSPVKSAVTVKQPVGTITESSRAFLTRLEDFLDEDDSIIQDDDGNDDQSLTLSDMSEVDSFFNNNNDSLANTAIFGDSERKDWRDSAERSIEDEIQNDFGSSEVPVSTPGSTPGSALLPVALMDRKQKLIKWLRAYVGEEEE